MGSKPSAPKYDTNAALQEQQRLNQAGGIQKYANVNGPMGGYSISVDPETGKMTVNKVLSDNSTAAMNNQLATLENYYASDPATAEQAYYNAQMAYLQPQMDRQVARTESRLTNRGLALGSSAWNEATGDMYDAQNQTLANLSNSALGAGQQYQSGMLNNASMLGGQIYDPNMVSGANGAGLYDTYDKQYQNAIDIYKTKMGQYNARQQALVQALNPLGGAAGSMMGSANNNQWGASGNNYITDINGNIIGQKGGYGGGFAIDPNQVASANNMIK